MNRRWIDHLTIAMLLALAAYFAQQHFGDTAGTLLLAAAVYVALRPALRKPHAQVREDAKKDGE